MNIWSLNGPPLGEGEEWSTYAICITQFSKVYGAG